MARLRSPVQPVEPPAPFQERPGELERRRQVAESLRGILGVLNSNLGLEDILAYIVGEARRLLGADAAAIYRLQPDQILSIQSAQGLTADYIAQADIPLGQLATGRAVLLRRPVTLDRLTRPLYLPEAASDPLLKGLTEQLFRQFQAVLAVPLVSKEKPTGTLTLYYVDERDFTQEDIDLAVAFCDQAALAIENAQLRERAMEEAISAERGRLARELHDSVTQELFSASLIAEVLPVVWERDPEEGRRALDELRRLTRGALAEMRTLLLELRPAGLQTARLEELLRQLVEAVSGRLRAPVALAIEGAPNPPLEVRLALYRIAQEALNNVARHSGAARVDVSLRALEGEPRGIDLRIRDDGCGFDPAAVPSDHLGLGIMRERAASIQAKIEITSRPGLGTEVRVVWQPPENEAPLHG